jgi:hypothetical protein
MHAQPNRRPPSFVLTGFVIISALSAGGIVFSVIVALFR